MNQNYTRDDAVELLQQLGLKEYEAKCFVALTRVPKATAKEVSDYSEVPRTRVYDAVRVLETQGLVEVQHSNPQQFRAVPVEEAITTLREQYEARFRMLADAIEDLDSVSQRNDDDEDQQAVWSLAGTTAIATRTQQLIADATDEVFLVVGDTSLLTDELFASLSDATDRGVSIVIGTQDEAVRGTVRNRVPDADVFVSGLNWLSDDVISDGSEEVAVGRLLLSDRATILVSSIDPETTEETAVYGRGVTNGLVVIVRRFLATGLLPTNDPDGDDADA